MTEHNNDTDNEQIEINPDASGIEKFDQAENKKAEKPEGKNNAEDPWDGLKRRKEEARIHKIEEEVNNVVARRRLRYWTWLAGSVIILVLLALLCHRVLCGFDNIVEVYKEKGNSDILWFYGFSIFSVMVAFLSVAMAFLNIFVFKKRNTEQERKDPLTRILATLSDILDILKKDKK